jgi:hypothetical protein
MSDESSRSARPYGQRRNDGAPTWWAALDRADLPDNEVGPAAHRRWYEDAEPVAPAVEVTGRAVRAPWYRAVLVGLLIAIVAALVLVLEWITAGDSDHDAFYITLLIGVPVGLASTVAILMARRSS